MAATRYPVPPLSEVVDDYHGEAVADPYRRLEDPDAPETAAFVAEQNALTEDYLAASGRRLGLRERLAELWDHPRVGTPFERGGRWFRFRSDGLANQPVLHVSDAPTGAGRVLLDPNELTADGTVAVMAAEVSEDGGKLAYATSAAGSDWRTIRVRDVGTGQDDGDLVEWTKWGAPAWRHDGTGFYYVALPAPTAGAELQEATRFPTVAFHRLGTAQAEDTTLFSAPDEPEWLVESIRVDERFVVVEIARGTRPESQLRVLDLERPEDGLLPLVADFAARVKAVANVGRTFFLVTDAGADRQRIVAVELEDPAPARWREVVPEAVETLLGAEYCGGRLVCHYLRDAVALLRVHDLDGTFVHEIPLPASSSLSEGPLEHAVIEGRPDSDRVLFKTVSFADVGTIWSHDLGSGNTEILERIAAPFDPEDFVTEQVFVESSGGARIPLFLAHRRDVRPSGDVPVLLEGYGGFAIPMTPTYSVGHMAWLERGGLLAIASLRGGGEYGRAWHDAGRLANKQNVFDDFCACARHLDASGWSRPERIAIHGGSNGGLLVGACLVQHPELFGAAVAEVGVLDMLRFQLFTIGWAWTSDYGDPSDAGDYRFIRSWSPLHNVTPGARYPATLLMTGDHDDRVVPGHSLKMAATLQAAQGGDAPILLQVETSGGHGAGKPTAMQIAHQADLLAFLESALGVAG